MGKYIVEFIGTFFLVLTICMTVMGGLGNFAPIAIGFVLMVMIYGGGHVSGAHYNPAVTVSVFLRGKVSAADVPGYIIAQCLAAFVAVFVAKALLTVLPLEAMAAAPVRDMTAVLLAEFLGTFALCWVILNVATAKATAGNSYFGLAIGCTVTACAYGLGPVSGGAFNPAVALGVSYAGLSLWSQIWMYIVAQLVAAAAAATVFKVTVEDQS